MVSLSVNIKQIKGSNELITQSNFVRDNLNGKISWSNNKLVLSVPLSLEQQSTSEIEDTSYVTKQYVDTQIANIDTGNHASAVSNYNSGTLLGTVTIDGNAVNFYVDLSSYAPLESPVFTGAPEADTPVVSTDGKRLATTAFVHRVKEALIDGAATNMNTLRKIAAALNNNPDYYQTVNTLLSNKLNKTDITVTGSSDNGITIGTISIDGTDYSFKIDLSSYAPLASPTFTGTPEAPTAAQGTATKQIATTAFVASAIFDIKGNPSTGLNTLEKISTALGNDSVFAQTINASVNGRQPLSAALTSIAGLTTSANKILYTTAKDVFAVSDISSFVISNNVLGSDSAETFRSKINALGTTEKAISATTADTAATCTGNAATATALQSAQTIKISNSDGTGETTGTSFDGTLGITLNLPATIKADINGLASKATILNNKRYIEGVAFDGSANVCHYAVCDTVADTATKTVVISGITNYSLLTGSRVTVKFVNGNTASNPLLSVNGTAAKSIYYRGFAVPADALQEMSTYDLVYNGLQWEIVGSIIWVQSTNPNLTVTEVKKTDGTTDYLQVSYNGNGTISTSVDDTYNFTVAYDSSTRRITVSFIDRHEPMGYGDMGCTVTVNLSASDSYEGSTVTAYFLWQKGNLPFVEPEE